MLMDLHEERLSVISEDFDAFVDCGEAARKPRVDHRAVNGGYETWSVAGFHASLPSLKQSLAGVPGNISLPRHPRGHLAMPNGPARSWSASLCFEMSECTLFVP